MIGFRKRPVKPLKLSVQELTQCKHWINIKVILFAKLEEKIIGSHFCSLGHNQLKGLLAEGLPQQQT